MSAPIDWAAPLELLDGTPVRLETAQELAGLYGGTNPDEDGDYWIIGEDGRNLGVCQCVAFDGTDGDKPIVRNRVAA